MLISAKEIKRIFDLDANKLCRDGELFGYKAREGNFIPWSITTTSLAMYLKYHPIILQGVCEIDTTWFGDDDMKLVNAMNRSLARNAQTEGYTCQYLSDIFDRPLNEIETLFGMRKSFAPLRFLSRLSPIPAEDVCAILRANPHYVELLQEKHKERLANADILESSTRHLLMLYHYYEQHGHLV